MGFFPWKALEAVAVGATEVFLVAPYIKADAFRQVLSLVHQDASLVCISRWRAADLLAGVSDADCRAMVSERGGEFRLHASLHAKYYRFDDLSFVGSANLTGAGLGLSPSNNLEILCQPGTGFDGPSFESKVLSGSRLVSDDEFAQWVSLKMPTEIEGQPKLSVMPLGFAPYNWRPQTREPIHLWWEYQGDQHLIPSGNERQLAQLDLQQLALPPGLEKSSFDRWIAASLLGSSFTSQILSLWDTDWDSARALLASEWEMGASESARAKETAELWLARFLPYIPHKPSHSSSIASA